MQFIAHRARQRCLLALAGRPIAGAGQNPESCKLHQLRTPFQGGLTRNVSANIVNIRAQSVWGTGEHECRAQSVWGTDEHECRMEKIVRVPPRTKFVTSVVSPAFAGARWPDFAISRIANDRGAIASLFSVAQSPALPSNTSSPL